LTSKENKSHNKIYFCSAFIRSNNLTVVLKKLFIRKGGQRMTSGNDLKVFHLFHTFPPVDWLPVWVCGCVKSWRGGVTWTGFQRESVCIDVVNASTEPELNQWITSQFADQKENNHTHLKCQKLPKRKSLSCGREMARHEKETETEGVARRRPGPFRPFCHFAMLTHSKLCDCVRVSGVYFLFNQFICK